MSKIMTGYSTTTTDVEVGQLIAQIKVLHDVLKVMIDQVNNDCFDKKSFMWFLQETAKLKIDKAKSLIG
jgi:hypothetical protein